MEKEIIYSTVVFNNHGTAPKEKKEDLTNDSEVKPKEAATVPTDGKAAARPHCGVLAACLGTLCVLLVVSISVIIYFSFVIKEQRANLSNFTAENELLIVERSNLSRVTDNLNWMLRVIRKFDTFPVNDYCPDDKCQPCHKDWIQFQEKCYLFYEERNPWKIWTESQTYCQNAAADLVVINNLHEQEFLTNHIKFYYDEYHGYWLGLTKSQDTNWVWGDGRNDTLGYWLMRDVDNIGNCGMIIPKRNFTANWDPAECSMKNKFICEIDVLIRSTS